MLAEQGKIQLPDNMKKKLAASPEPSSTEKKPALHNFRTMEPVESA